MAEWAKKPAFWVCFYLCTMVCVKCIVCFHLCFRTTAEAQENCWGEGQGDCLARREVERSRAGTSSNKRGGSPACSSLTVGDFELCW